MKSLSLAILMVVTLPLAAAAQASGKDIVAPRSHPAADLRAYDKYEDVLDRIEAHPAADLKAYDKYEDVLDRIAAYHAANLMVYDKYEDVLDRIEAYQAGLLKLRSGIARKDNKDR